ncbi:eCIS core domain-containing protein [Sorangium sp. So ce341]|uniref:eCIS core domain-containing protein n=1 Tax=Sorangium sp. So ce341 TaxID=3133302 RepID=UPI003F614BC8
MQIAVDRSSPKTSGNATRTSGARAPAPLLVRGRAMPLLPRPPAASTRAALEQAFGAEFFAAAAKAAGPGVGTGSGPGRGVNSTGIPSPVKAKMEAAFGADFSGVRVHQGSTRAAALRAVAYTQGSEIHVAPGRWAPETRAGQALLGHELAHVMQQRAGRVRPTTTIAGVAINDDPALETEADALGAKAARGDQVPASDTRAPQSSLACSPLQRSPLVAQRTPDEATGPREPGNYHINGRQRRFYRDYGKVAWGRTDPEKWPQDPKKQRAILYETIAIPGQGFNDLVVRFGGTKADPHDLGLTVMLNKPYEGNRHEPAEKDLDRIRAGVFNGWSGPPVSIGTLVWDRGTEGNIREAVPFATLRKEAAASPEAGRIRDKLEKNHNFVWRKLGDDDMPFVVPDDANSAAMKALGEEESKPEYEGIEAHFVTFGYNLTTGGVTDLMRRVLKAVYGAEMQLRDEIAEDPQILTSYPIEPNTFYRLPRDTEGMIYNEMVGTLEGVGGGGQIKEGLRLLAAARRTLGPVPHSGRHTTSENTAAGGRNDELINVLTPLVNDANAGNAPPVDRKTEVRARIERLDQSYFGAGVWQRNVREITGKDVDPGTVQRINALVEKKLVAIVNLIFRFLNQEAATHREGVPA